MIPMGGPLPVLGQPTVAYGAAAIMVHPASGYMINRVILQAPEVAAAIASTLRDTDCPKLAAEAGWEAIWPKHRLIERDLYCFGMEVLLGMHVCLAVSLLLGVLVCLSVSLFRACLSICVCLARYACLSLCVSL